MLETHAAGGGATVRGLFTFDATTGVLTYDVVVSGVEHEEIHAVVLHRAGGEGSGPIIALLSGLGIGSATGNVHLTNAHRDALEAGRLYVRLYTSAQPDGAARGTVVRR